MAAPPDTDPAPARDGLIAWSIAGLVAATVLIGALAPGAPAHRTLSPADDPVCAEWSDGCTVCQRSAEGPSCSLPGIACTKKAPECLHRT